MSDSKPDGTAYPVQHDDQYWREKLDPLSYQVLRHGATEQPYTGEYLQEFTAGVYRCRACDAELFRSDTKFTAHCGWPAFYSPLAGDRIVEIVDTSAGMVRTEVRCAACGSHLGHVFEGEGYDTPTDLRYCINSVSLQFETE